MKISAILIALFLPLMAYAFPPEFDGTMMPYDFAESDSVVPWNDDMHPVYINYVARHGARFLSSEKKIISLRDYLEKARDNGSLTAKGKSFLSLIDRVDKATDGEWGALNATGIMEEKRLGNEMAAIAPQLLKEGRVIAVSSYVPRVVMTMYELCHQLARYSSDLEIFASDGHQYDPLLRYFKTDKAYADYIDNGPWTFAYDNFYRENVPVGPGASLINGIADKSRLQKMTSDMYGILQSLRAAGIECDPARWFSEEEYLKCWEAANLKHYYQRSASSFSNLPALAATPLLKGIVERTDSCFESRRNIAISEIGGIPPSNDEKNPVKAYLCFGHAETVLPLFSLMRLPGCYAPLLNPQEVAFQWKDWEISPLGANLLMVCLEDKAGKPFVALRLNGKWLEFNGKKLIEWHALRSDWQSYMN